MKRITYSLWLGSLFLLSCQEKKEVFVNFSNPELDYSGRVNFDNKEGAEFYWTGTSIKMNFEGENISAILKDESGDNYYNVIIERTSLGIIITMSLLTINLKLLFNPTR